MKLCAVQIRPTAGDVAANIAKHLQFIELAAAHGADLVFFPELSLTGYEPRLARSLATDEVDPRFDVFQQRSDALGIIIGVGVPLSAGSQLQIGMVWFAPCQLRRTYAKQQLHADEVPFFVEGDSQITLEVADHTITPAICYESLQMNHADKAANLGADVYLASVAKSTNAVAKAALHYPAIARKHHMYVLMANGVGPSDNFVSVGQSAAWDKNGALLCQMDSESEGMVMLDMSNDKACIHMLTAA